jgi:hypothetical protein
MGEDEAIQRNDAQHGVHPQSIDTHTIAANWSPEAHCIGEKIASIRQLIKRFGNITQALFFLDNPSNNLLIAPFSVPNPTNAVATGRNISLFEYYYFIYGFWRGSMRFKTQFSVRTAGAVGTANTVDRKFKGFINAFMWSSVQDSFNALVNRFIAGNAPVIGTGTLPSGSNNMGTSLQYIDPNVEGIVEVEVPYYNISHISPATTYALTERPVEIANVLKGHIPPVLLALSPQTIPTPGTLPAANERLWMNIQRAPGDDFSLMYLVGVPPLVNVDRATIP